MQIHYNLYISTIINKNTPNSLWKNAQCRKPKKVCKKVATLEKTNVLCRFYSFISLWVHPTPTIEEGLNYIEDKAKVVVSDWGTESFSL